MKLKASLSIAAVLLHLSSAALPNVGVAHAASHKMRSAHFLTTTLEKKGFAVDGVHRKGQVYFVKVAQDGTTAILAIDGYSAEIIGLNVLILAPGVTAKAQGTGGNHFVDLTYEYGYIVEETVYEASYELTVEEISVTEEYTEVSYEESEEVTYEEVEETAEADLDDGTAEDAAGDAEADANETPTTATPMMRMRMPTPMRMMLPMTRLTIAVTARRFDQQRRWAGVDDARVVDLRDLQDLRACLRFRRHLDQRHLVRHAVQRRDVGDLQHFHQLVELLAGLLDLFVVGR